MILPKTPLGPEAPIEICDDHVLTTSNVDLDLLVDNLSPHWQLGKG